MTDTTEHRAGAVADVGVVGLAANGSKLARRLGRHGYAVALYDPRLDNLTPVPTQPFVTAHGADGNFVPTAGVSDLVAALDRPRRIFLMVQPGDVTDTVIDNLLTHLEPGDILVDGGKAHYTDTRRRESSLRTLGVHFVGAGFFGDMLSGPIVTTGGSRASYAALAPVLQDIAAKVDGEPCCAYTGADGAGHFVKMVLDGIADADMQLMVEAHDILCAAGLSVGSIAAVLRGWNAGDPKSLWMEVMAGLLEADDHTRRASVDATADEAAATDTGRWTVQAALELGVPVGVIAESVFALSASGKPTAAGSLLTGPHEGTLVEDMDRLVTNLGPALWVAKAIACAQGLEVIAVASTANGWDIDIADVARVWRGSSVVRSHLLDCIRHQYADRDPSTLVAAPDIGMQLGAAQGSLRAAVTMAVGAGIPVPALGSALAYYDIMRKEQLPASLARRLRLSRAASEGSVASDSLCTQGDHPAHDATPVDSTPTAGPGNAPLGYRPNSRVPTTDHEGTHRRP